MAIIITDECINCGACEPECPNNAIYEGAVEWSISEGNTVTGMYTLEDGSQVDVEDKQAPIEDDYYSMLYEESTKKTLLLNMSIQICEIKKLLQINEVAVLYIYLIFKVLYRSIDAV